MLSNTKTKLVLPRMDKNLVEEAVNGEVTNKKEFVYVKRPTMASGCESGRDPRLLTKAFSNMKGDNTI